MSKLQTVRDLSASAPPPQLAVIESLQNLSGQLQSLHQELQTLPPAVAGEIAEALAPLAQMQRDMQTALRIYPQLEQAQRATLADLTREMSDQAAAAMEAKSAQLAEALAKLEPRIKSIEASTQRADMASRKLEGLPAAISSEAQVLNSTAERLKDAASELRPSWMNRAFSGLLLAAVTAGAVLIGQRVLSEPARPGAAMPTQQQVQDAETLRRLWANATERERESIRRILSRPAQ